MKFSNTFIWILNLFLVHTGLRRGELFALKWELSYRINAKKAVINKNMTLHQLRYTFANRALKIGVDINIISQ